MTNMTLYRKENTLFTVHVGDMQKPPRTLCAYRRYYDIAQLLQLGPLPTFCLPGDNDWVDCEKPEESLGYFRDFFGTFETQWQELPPGVEHMNVQYHAEFPEIFQFSHAGILFLSVHLIDTRKKETEENWDYRMQVNIDWVAQHVVFYVLQSGSVDALRGVVIFGHGQFSQDTMEFFKGIAPVFLGNGDPQWSTKPVMYLHGDGHNWDTNDKVQKQLNWNSFIDVQVDQGAYADPCLVEIATNPGQVLEQEHDLQYVFGGGIFRVDRQRGRYPDARNGQFV